MIKQKHKKHKKQYQKEYTTFDPKIHIKIGSGYHMKPNAHDQDLSGRQLANILGCK